MDNAADDAPVAFAPRSAQSTRAFTDRCAPRLICFSAMSAKKRST
jgi:hypothetical protein